ncbi:flavin reductase domain protein FMN-binding protein [Komagataeibacter xylinus E25]|nr:flavin reductase domain protein FMN-binding protein [Komagataeibacter xylinus E25]
MGNSFKMAMRRLAATVNVITCESNGVPFGMTATAVTALSADPESLLICINRAARICATIEERRAFCVNILATHHADVSQTFGGMAKGVERFDIGTWECAETGLPYLVDAQANVFCDLDHFVSYGTHNVFLGV